eukprot:2584083-Prorocentrum_lima.AAC.1
MTSSLVGSEMCIRDRSTTGATRAWHSIALFGRTWARTRWRQFGRTSCPVSYTHLTLPTICSV